MQCNEQQVQQNNAHWPTYISIEDTWYVKRKFTHCQIVSRLYYTPVKNRSHNTINTLLSNCRTVFRQWEKSWGWFTVCFLLLILYISILFYQSLLSGLAIFFLRWTIEVCYSMCDRSIPAYSHSMYIHTSCSRSISGKLPFISNCD